jgi:predicted AlkP superfamily pyrophosphatase or phosphodiesterase
VRPATLATLLVAWLATAAEAAPTVILLSWDGVRHDYPDRTDTPALARLTAEGARAERLLPVFPSNTFPGHVSLATGTHPDRHGIVDNHFLDRKRGRFSMESDASWIEAEPLWAAAERQGVPAAVFFWVGSETDWRGTGARYRKAPFDSRIGEAEKVEQILAWLALEEPERPRLVMAWWHGADRVGHRAGPDGASVAEALREQDAQLARLLEALDARNAWRDTTLLVVSDHGMTPVLGEVPVRDHVSDSGIAARVQAGGAVAHVFLDEAADLPRAEASLRILRHVSVYRDDALPESLRLRHPTRTGDLVVIAEPGYVFRGTSWGRRVWRQLAALFGYSTGMHGYAPDHPDMGGVLLALGRGVPAGSRLPAAHMIDIAPTVARLLGIEPPLQAEGVPIEALLAD